MICKWENFKKSVVLVLPDVYIMGTYVPLVASYNLLKPTNGSSRIKTFSPGKYFVITFFVL